MKNAQSNIVQLGAMAIVFAVALFLLGSSIPVAEAAQSPAGCTADNSVVNISASDASAVEGDTITFTVSAGNPASVDGCDIVNRTMTLTLPDGTQEVFGPFNYPNPTAVAEVGSADYVADDADAENGFWTANVTWTGTLKTVSDLPSTGSKNASVLQITPLLIEKTVNTSFDREWTWDIEKSVDETSLAIAEGESDTVTYEVEVSAVSEDTNRTASGTITITNPAGNADAIIANVTDVMDDSGALTVDCTTDANFTSFPYTLSAGETLECSYEGDASLDDTENTATVVVTDQSITPGNTVTEDVTFSGTPGSETDECITVSDTNPNGPQDVEVCAENAPETFTYDVTFGPDGEEGTDVAVECGDLSHPNTADFTTNDTDATDEATVTVDVTVECITGCTLTQGYWKTHNASFKGGAKADPAWLNIGAGGETTQFFTSGMTWFEVFNTPPKGNAWYNLAHQYMAAKLNILNEAEAPAAVEDAIDDAEALFGNALYNTPAEFAALGKKDPIRAEAITLAGILGSFNEGTTGPGHCGDDETSDN